MKYWLRQCPRCEGDLRAEVDRHGWCFVDCVQCGYILSETEELHARSPASPGRRHC
jgi:hypothetical protein